MLETMVRHKPSLTLGETLFHQDRETMIRLMQLGFRQRMGELAQGYLGLAKSTHEAEVSMRELGEQIQRLEESRR